MRVYFFILYLTMEVRKSMQSDEVKKSIGTRLRRIEGQVKGIEKMVDNDTCCMEVLTQIAAVRAAINKVGLLVMENYAKDCILSSKDDDSRQEEVEELLSTVLRFLK